MATVTQPLLETIEADDPAPVAPATPNVNVAAANASSNARGPTYRPPTSTTPADLEAGL